MQVRLLLGCAGSGKTFRCLSEARQALRASAEGLPLLVLAPKQGTYQLEQQLLAEGDPAGYTRLSVLPFDSVARLVYRHLNRPCPDLLSEEGRIMVLRALLAENRDRLKVFRASARLTGFARQLSLTLAEVERAGMNAAALRQVAMDVPETEALGGKLRDLALLLEAYEGWLSSHELFNGDSLLKAAADWLRNEALNGFQLDALWVDGFADFSELELDLLCALLPHCRRATLTFCLDAAPREKGSWLSHWSLVSRNFKTCRERLSALRGVEIVTETLDRQNVGRFRGNLVLGQLERRWETGDAVEASQAGVDNKLRLVECANREEEVTVAAQEIHNLVRGGGRYRDAAVLLRNFEPYHQLIQRVFTRFEIPFFLDRRESVAHHALAELTRSALRVVAFGWQQADWFAALKSGLVPVGDEEIDLLENQALEHGWDNQAWHQPIRLRDEPRTDEERARLEQLETRLESLRVSLVQPFESFAQRLEATGNRVKGAELADAVRELWNVLGVEQQLEKLAAFETESIRHGGAPSVHHTVWNQMNAWLDNAALAFPREPLTLREWIPVLEAGIANLSVGIIPPSADQVLVGAVDRSRTPEVSLAFVLGLHEGEFPARPDAGGLFTETDRVTLENREILLGPSRRRHLSRERYLAYIACSRARERLVLTWAVRDEKGAPLLPSGIISHVRHLFPGLQPELALPDRSWQDAVHPSEFAEAVLKSRAGGVPWVVPRGESEQFASAGVAALLAAPPQQPARCPEQLSERLAARLYGPVLRTSVSRMEQFAACPFRFFVHSGLRAEERRLFELDAREQGTFQHDLLALFHQQLRREGKRWRDITPQQARDRVKSLAAGLLGRFRGGLLDSSEETRFTARVLTESLQDFVETIVEWMQAQYRFDPVEVEFPFGEDGGLPWKLTLSNGNALELRGRIDRIDLFPHSRGDGADCVVIDYKSSQKQLDPLLIEHGLQLQLLAYLNVLRHWPNPREVFGVDRLEPAGVFYVNLRGRYGNEANRTAALADPDGARKMAYRHAGRFDARALPQLDSRSDVEEGDQFSYRLTRQRKVYRNCKEAMATPDFETLLERVAETLRHMGEQVYAGMVEVRPYRIGALTACAQCSYQAICRLDPWTDSFRVLKRGVNSPTPPAREKSAGA